MCINSDPQVGEQWFLDWCREPTKCRVIAIAVDGRFVVAGFGWRRLVPKSDLLARVPERPARSCGRFAKLLLALVLGVVGCQLLYAVRHPELRDAERFLDLRQALRLR